MISAWWLLLLLVIFPAYFVGKVRGVFSQRREQQHMCATLRRLIQAANYKRAIRFCQLGEATNEHQENQQEKFKKALAALDEDS